MKESIDITPSFHAAAGCCILTLESASEEGKRIARAEIRRMGKLLDELLAKLEEGSPANSFSPPSWNPPARKVSDLDPDREAGGEWV